MKKIISSIRKKALLSIIIALIIVTQTTFYSSAFGGYAHYTMAFIKGVESGKSESYQRAYRSGCLIADIGKASWDNKYDYESDEYTFTNKLYDYAKASDSALSKYFAYGWRDHYIQDNKGSVANTKPPKGITSYRLRCGWIDEFLRDEWKLDNPIQHNELNKLYIDYSLIKKTYKFVANYTPTNDQIDKQIKNMFALYDAQIALNIFGWSDAQRKAIDEELARTKDLCIGLKAGNVPNYNSKTTNATKQVNLFYDAYCGRIEELTNYITIEKEQINESSAYLTVKINDFQAYQNKLDFFRK